MVPIGKSVCPVCGGKLKYYDQVPRIVRTKNRLTMYFRMRRLKCTSCERVHREIPGFIYPYKQYDLEVMKGVLEGFITPDTIGYEDYPCEATMLIWRSQNLHILL